MIVPKELYVVSKPEIEREYPIPGDYNVYNDITHNFGFLHPHEPRLAADAKRKNTQHEWAYGLRNHAGDTLTRASNGWMTEVTRYNYSTGRPVSEIVTTHLQPEYEPRIWPNTPMTGFKLIDTVNRYRGNKLFKVLDPRGVEFEITVQSLYHILCHGAVANGVIIDACVWKSGKNLVLANNVSKTV